MTDRTGVNERALPMTTPSGRGHDAVSIAATEANLAVGIGSLTAWVVLGVGAAVLLRRRGHELSSLLAMALVFGPLVWRIVRRDPSPVPWRELAEGTVGSGDVDVVVAVDGTELSTIRALTTLIDLGDRRLGSVTLAAAVNFETLDDEEWDDDKVPAAIGLELAASMLRPRCDPRLVLVGGRSGRAQVGWAAEQRADAVVVPTPQRVPKSVRHRPTVVIAEGGGRGSIERLLGSPEP